MKKLLTVLRYLLFLGIGALLLWLSFRNQSFSLVWTKIRHANPFWIGISVCLGILALVIRAIRWKQLIESLGYSPRLFSTYNSVMVGYLANMAVPRLGEITRCGVLSKSDKVPFDKLVGTVIVERASDVIMLLLSIVLVAVIESERLMGFLLNEVWNPVLQKLTSHPELALLVIGILFVGLLITIYFFRMSNPPKPIIKIIALLKGVLEGLQSIRKLRSKGLFLLYSCLIWAIYLLMTYVCFFAIPETSGLDLSAGLFVTVLGGVAMTAPVQGGFGAYHYLVSLGLILFGVSADDGIVFATLVHTTQTILLVVAGFISLILLFFFTPSKPSATT